MSKKLFFLSLFTVLLQFTSTAQGWAEAQKAVNGDRAPDDRFGYSVAISGDQAIVGAYYEDEDASGGSTLSSAGSAYIFTKVAGVWTQQAKLVASDRAPDDFFGYSVAISGDQAIVGAWNEDEDASGGSTLRGAGSAYIFAKVAGLWTQQAKLVASDRSGSDYFGHSVAISGDQAIVGAWNEDEDASGGSTLYSAGSAYIFAKVTGVWTQQAKLVASDRSSFDYFGYSVAISGDQAIVGAEGPGWAYIFAKVLGVWTQQAKLVASDRRADDGFGLCVAISGDQAIVGAEDEDEDASGGNTLGESGSAYIFAKVAGVWTQQAKLVASDRYHNDRFGCSVAISGDQAIVGAYLEDEEASGGSTINNAGSAYIFGKVAGVWTQQAKLVASDRAAQDRFGRSVAISGDQPIVGAYGDDVASGGSTLSFAGSAYFFELFMTVSGNTQSIVNGATPELANHTSFGSLASGGSVTRTFTILNSGIEDVTLNGSPAVAISGSGDFTVSTQPSTTIAPGASVTFEVTFTPTASGKQTAELSISSNDPNSLFTFEVSGKLNTAMDFDGVDDFCEITPFPNIYSITNNFTIEFLFNATATITVKPENTAVVAAFGGDQRFLLYPQNGVFTDPVQDASLGISVGSNAIQVFEHGTDYAPCLLSYSGSLSGWNHGAIVYNSNTPSLYINGVLVKTGLTSLKASVCPSAYLGGVASGNYQGDIDEFRIWNRVLCQAEIVGRMNSPLQGNENGLVVYYDFEEGLPDADNTGLASTVFDKAGTNHGTMSGFAKNTSASNWVDGIDYNQIIALDFDGGNDFVDCGSFHNDYFSVEAWFNASVLPLGVWKVISAQFGAPDLAYEFDIQPDNTVGLLVSQDGSTFVKANSTAKIATGVWYHVAGTYDGTELKVYVNGILEGSASMAQAGPMHASIGKVLIGATRNGTVNSYNFNGKLHEVRIWNTARTAQQIKDNMNTSFIGNEQNLVAYYNFEEGVPGGTNTALTTVIDKTGSNPGALTNFAKTGTTSNWVNGTIPQGVALTADGLITGTTITWVGGTTSFETDWNTAANWSPANVPTQCNDVVIPTTNNDPSFADAQAVNSIEIQTSANLTVGTGGCLWVGSTFTNDGEFVLEASASSYAQYLGPQVKGTLSQVISEAGWHNISSPFIDATLGDIEFTNEGMLEFGAADKCNINYYNSDVYQASQSGWTTSWGNWECASGLSEAFDGSKAYSLFLDPFFASSFPVTMRVRGTLRNMPLTQELKKSNGGWNQLSNPFPSVVDFDKLYNNSEIGNSYRLWDAVADDYGTYVVGVNGAPGTSVPNGVFTRYIAPYQGVFVKTTGSATLDPGSDDAMGTQTHSISNADRPTTCPSTINQFYKTSLTGNLYLVATSGTLSNQLAIRFDNSFNEGYVLEEEVEKFFSPNTAVPSIYTILENQAYVISSYPEPAVYVQGIPLGLNTTAKNITLEAIEVPEGMTVILEDKQLEVFHNLENPYVFTNVEEEETDRFKLHVGGENSNINSILGGDQIVYTQNQTLVFYDSEKLLGGKLLLINIAGQELLKGTVTQDMQIDVSGYVPGIYVIQVNNRGTVKTQRIVVR